jgi:hypothetical protein
MGRRRRARYASSGRSDWIWAAGLLVFGVLLLGGGYFLLSAVAGGSGGSSCDNRQAPLGASDLTEAGYLADDESLAAVERLLAAGRVAEAESSFYLRSHAFAHDADAGIRERNEQTAKDLCEAVRTMEADFEVPQQPGALVSDVRRVRAYLAQGAQALGYNLGP